MDAPPKSAPRRIVRKVFAVAGILFLLLAGAAVAAVWPRTIVISPETTYITGPITPDGRPDYVGYLNEKHSKGLTPESNAAAVLFQVVDPQSIPPEYRERFYQMLGVPQPHPDDVVEPFQKFADRQPRESGGDAPIMQITDGSYEQFIFSRRQPTADNNPKLAAAWIEANSVPLEKLKAANGLTRIYVPVISHDETIKGVVGPEFGSISPVLELLRTRATLRLKAGERDLAIDDALLLKRLERLLTYVVVPSYRYNVRNTRQDPATELILRGGLDLPRMQRLRAGLNDLPPVADVQNEGEYWRFLRLSLITESWQHGHTFATFPVGTDPNALLRLWNIHFSQDLANHANKDPTALFEGMRKHAREILQQRQEIKPSWVAQKLAQLRQWFSGPGPAPGQVAAAAPLQVIDLPHVIQEVWPSSYNAAMEDRAQTEVALQNLGAAVVEHQLRTGQLPATLDALVPDELKSLPIDPWTKQPYQYRVENGRFALTAQRDYPYIQETTETVESAVLTFGTLGQ